MFVHNHANKTVLNHQKRKFAWNPNDEFQNLFENVTYNSAMQLLNRRHYISLSGSLPYSGSSFCSSLYYLNKTVRLTVWLHFSTLYWSNKCKTHFSYCLIELKLENFFQQFFPSHVSSNDQYNTNSKWYYQQNC